MNKQSTVDFFRNPDAGARGAPFWAWNSVITPDEARRQIEVMKEMGFGGFFMHSRVGMDVPYLKEEWFDVVKASIEAAKANGMNAWLYDEDRWPSGSAGGLVTRPNPEFRSRSIDFELAPFGGNEGETLAVFAVKPFDGGPGSAVTAEERDPRKVFPGGIASFRRLPGNKNAELQTGEYAVRFFVHVSEPDSWYNNGTYVDTLSVDAVSRFVEITHEAYKRETGGEFGKTVPGIFSDEPNMPNFAWTGEFPRIFRMMHGYDVLDKLPEIMFPVHGRTFVKSRYDFKKTAAHMFVTAFAKTIGDWCSRNGLFFTGHVLSEDTLMAQTICAGSAMQFYEYMSLPGIDLLTECWNIFGTAKQCVSAARQFGRRRRLSETYGCTGWDFPFEGHKALGDWQLALGINLRCHHLAWYSMEGENKRDYPASINFQSPWWRKYRFVEDYYARLGAVLDSGAEVSDILVIHPVESMWGIFSGTDSAAVSKLEDEFVAIRNELLGSHLEFDYGDEEIMSRHAQVLKNGTLRVGESKYKAVVVPELLTIRASTLKLLADFASAGGLVISIGEPPARVDAEETGEAAEVFAAFKHSSGISGICPMLEHIRRVSVRSGGSEIRQALCMVNERPDGLALFVCNTSQEFADARSQMNYPKVRFRKDEFPQAEISVKYGVREAFVYEFDAMTGSILAIDSSYDPESALCTFRTSLGRLASRLFFLTSEKIPDAVTRPPSGPSGAAVPLPCDSMPVSMDEDNVIVLDHAESFEINHIPGDASGEFVLRIDDRLRKTIGMMPHGGHMCQPWVMRNEPDGPSAEFSVKFAFECAERPVSDCFLAYEMSNAAEAFVNGTKVSENRAGFWVDPCLAKFTIPAGIIRTGRNEVVIKGTYTKRSTGLEACFVCGKFGVDAQGAMCSAPAALSAGDWTSQGLPNYIGNLSYEIQIPDGAVSGASRVFVRIPKWNGAALDVSVNGNTPVMLPWPPYETEITKFLAQHDNVLRITVYGNRRNAMGPFYYKNTAETAWFGSWQLRDHQTSERELVEMGLLAPVEIAAGK